MNQRKRFVAPKVVQEVRIQLEKDLLGGPSVQYDAMVRSAGQGVNELDFTPLTGEEVNDYTVEWD